MRGSAMKRKFKGGFVFDYHNNHIAPILTLFVVVQMGEEYYHAKDYSKAIK